MQTSALSTYLNRQLQYPVSEKQPFESERDIIVVIPAYKEIDLTRSINSLWQSRSSFIRVGIIVHFNQHEEDDETAKEIHHQAISSLKTWYEGKKSVFLELAIMESILPERDAGVGLARKIGMDWAVRSFEKWQKPNGIIACFDADSICEKNYLIELKSFFDRNRPNGVSIHFEHPYVELKDRSQAHAIIRYELHLRYLVHGFRYAGVRQAFHAIGSSMAVTAEAYAKQGGMNKRKAGEDFYFMQKIVNLGRYFELNTTTVYPSARESDRVPFGTGRAMMDAKCERKEFTFSYAWNNFETLRELLEHKVLFYEDPEAGFKKSPSILQPFLSNIHFVQSIKKLSQNSSNSAQFDNAFHQWFDGFKAMKAMHFLRDHICPDQTLLDGVAKMMRKEGATLAEKEYEAALLQLREWDKTHPHFVL
jgi:hypothetical protein